MHRTVTVIDIILIVFGSIITLQYPRDPDLWWHLRVGHDLLKGIFPFHDLYTWSMSGYAWVDHEWLTDSFMYIVQQTTGLVGLGLLFSAITYSAYLLATRTGALVQRHISPQNPLSAALSWRLGFALTLISLFANSDIIGTRAQMISLLGFAAANYFVWQYLTRERQSLWILIPLFCLWANLHGGFTLGLLLVGLTLLTFIGARLIHSLHAAFPYSLTSLADLIPRIRHLALILLLSVAASLINPYTYRVYEEALRTGTDTIARRLVTEWQSINFQDFNGLLLGVFIFAFLIWMVWTRRNQGAWHLLLLPVFLYLGFSSVRHAAPLIIFILPWVFANVAGVPLVQKLIGVESIRWFGIRRANNLHYAYNGILVVIVLAMFSFRFWQFATYSTDMSLLSATYRYPRQAVEYLKVNAHTDDLIFNDYGWGGYLIWFLPEHKVYIDGRMPSWQTEDKHILIDYAHISLIAPDWMDVLHTSHATLVLADTKSYLASALAQVDSFERVYQDDVAAVYRARNP